MGAAGGATNEAGLSDKARGKRRAVDEAVDVNGVTSKVHDVESNSAVRVGPRFRRRLNNADVTSESFSRTSRSQSVLTDTTSSTLPNGSVASGRRSRRDARENDVQSSKRRRLLDGESGIRRQLRAGGPQIGRAHV